MLRVQQFWVHLVRSQETLRERGREGEERGGQSEVRQFHTILCCYTQWSVVCTYFAHYKYLSRFHPRGLWLSGVDLLKELLQHPYQGLVVLGTKHLGEGREGEIGNQPDGSGILNTHTRAHAHIHHIGQVGF